MAGSGREPNGERLAKTFSTAGIGSSIAYPSYLLTEDAPQPPSNTRSQEPEARIDLLVSTIELLQAEGVAELPIAVGTLYVLVNQAIRRRSDGSEELEFLEFKAVARCMVMDRVRRIGLDDDGRVCRRDLIAGGEVIDEEEVVRLIGVGMEEVRSR